MSLIPTKRLLSLQSGRSLCAATSLQALAFNVVRNQYSYKPIAIHQHRNTSTTTSSVTGLTTPGPSSLLRANELYLSKKVPDLFSLQDRVVVVTGGARGIGLALAFAVAEVGGKIAIIDAAAEPHEHYQKLKEVASHVAYYRSDVTDYHVLRQTFDEIATDFGSIHGCIAAAGICPDQPFIQRKPQDVRRCFDINVLGTYFIAQLTAERIVHRSKEEPKDSTVLSSTPDPNGSIVLIGSVAAHQASKGQFLSDYAASKGAVRSLTKELGVELAPYGIRVNCISPGYIMTDLMADIVEVRPDLAEIVTTEPPIKRMGDRTDLKGAAVFLLSEASAYMTGAEMLITGGLDAR